MTSSANADAVRLFHEALAADQANDQNNAFQLSLASLAADPTLPGTWNNLGMTLHKLRKFAAAVPAFYRSYTLAPDQILPLANYAWSLQLAGRPEEAYKIVTERILPKEPDQARHWTNLAQVCLTLNLLQKALEAAQTAVKLGDNRPEAPLVLGLAQLRLGRYAEGLKNYEARMVANPVLRLLLNNPYPIWRGEDLTTKRLFIPCEQGIGDSVMFLSFIIKAAERAKTVIVHVHAQALKFYQRNLPRNVECRPTPCELPAADFFCPTLSLPVALGLSDEEIPATMRKLRFAPVHFHGLPTKGNTLRIGIAWAGDPNHDNDAHRSAPLSAFMPLAELPNVQLFSLQYGARTVDLDNLGVHGTIKNLAPYIRDVNDTAALIAQHIDAVITVDTSVAHIAGAVGKPTYLLLGKQSVDWRWGIGLGKSCWYPNTELVIQDNSDDWSMPIEYVRGRLAARQSVS